MARKKAPKILQGRTGQSIVDRLERAVSTVANAASMAATGSELGVLELAVEDDLGVRKAKAKRAKKAARTKTAKKTKRPAVKRRNIAAKRTRHPARKVTKRKRVAKRRSR